MNAQLVQLIIYALVIAFVLLQWFMCERPLFFWGLALPIILAVAWYCVVKQPLSIFEALGLTEGAIALMSQCCKLGIIASLGEYVLIRGLRLLRSSLSNKRRDQRLEEKRRRDLREAAVLNPVQPGSVPSKQQGPFRQ